MHQQRTLKIDCNLKKMKGRAEIKISETRSNKELRKRDLGEKVEAVGFVEGKHNLREGIMSYRKYSSQGFVGSCRKDRKKSD